jgi:hypothetical protein
MRHFTLVRLPSDGAPLRYLGWYYDVESAQRQAEAEFAGLAGRTPSRDSWHPDEQAGEPLWTLQHGGVRWIVQQEDAPIVGGPPDPDMVAVFAHADGTTHTWEGFQNPPPYQWSARTHPSLGRGDFRLTRFDEGGKRAWYEEAPSHSAA